MRRFGPFVIGYDPIKPITKGGIAKATTLFLCAAAVLGMGALSLRSPVVSVPNIVVTDTVTTAPKGFHLPPTPYGVTLSGLQDYNLGPGIIQMMKNQIHAARFTWHLNTIRFQIVQDELVTYTGETVDTEYLGEIKDVVDYCLSLGMYCIINPQTEQTTGFAANEKLPNYATQQFWHVIMGLYANNPKVIFDLFNEPRGVNWAEWYSSTQPLITYIREHGARYNTIYVEGLSWASSLMGMPQSILGDYGVIASYHHLGRPWAGPGHKEGPENWQVWYNHFGYLAAQGYHIVDGEITFFKGGYNLPMKKIILYFKFCKQYHIGVIYWTLNAGVMNGKSGFASIGVEPQSSGNLFYHFVQDQLTAQYPQAAGIGNAGGIRHG